MCAKLCLVFFNVIQSFYPVVGKAAGVFLFTLFSVGELAKIRRVCAFFSSLVHEGVVVWAVLVVVLALNIAFVNLKSL